MRTSLDYSSFFYFSLCFFFHVYFLPFPFSFFRFSSVLPYPDPQDLCWFYQRISDFVKVWLWDTLYVHCFSSLISVTDKQKRRNIKWKVIKTKKNSIVFIICFNLEVSWEIQLICSDNWKEFILNSIPIACNTHPTDFEMKVMWVKPGDTSDGEPLVGFANDTAVTSVVVIKVRINKVDTGHDLWWAFVCGLERYSDVFKTPVSTCFCCPIGRITKCFNTRFYVTQFMNLFFHFCYFVVL